MLCAAKRGASGGSAAAEGSRGGSRIAKPGWKLAQAAGATRSFTNTPPTANPGDAERRDASHSPLHPCPHVSQGLRMKHRSAARHTAQRANGKAAWSKSAPGSQQPVGLAAAPEGHHPPAQGSPLRKEESLRGLVA